MYVNYHHCFLPPMFGTASQSNYVIKHKHNSIIKVFWDRKQSLSAHFTAVSLTHALSFLSLISHYKGMPSRASKYSSWTNTRLSTSNSKSEATEENWPNRQGERWPDGTSSSSTLPRRVWLTANQGASQILVSITATLKSSDVFIPILLALLRGVRQQYPSIH